MSPTEPHIEPLQPELYAELRSLARRALVGEGPARTIQTTELAHELYLRLERERSPAARDRARLLAVASIHVRRLLVDLARARALRRAEGARVEVESADPDDPACAERIDLLALDEALANLSAMNATDARIVELRFFGGLTWDEIGAAVGLARRTAIYRWDTARAWLRWQIDGRGRA